jgi:S1-C subfamily serine protease
MRKLVSLLAVMLLFTALAWAQTDDPLTKIVAQVKGSVVSVNTKSLTYGSVSGGMGFESSRYQQIATGWLSGFVYDKKGYIITDSKDLEGAKILTVYTSDNVEIPAEVVGLDQDYGIGVIKVKSDKPLTPVKIMATPYDQVHEIYPYGQGDTVIAIGASGGLGGTVTTGIISAMRNMRNRSGTLIPNMIQSDVKINGGNEGCPLFNGRGEVIGMHEMRGAGLQGIAWFTPMWLVNRIAGELIANYESKKPLKDFKVWHPWLGIKPYTGPVNRFLGSGMGVGDDLKMFMNIPDQYWDTGFLVDTVYPDSPSSEYGLMSKDYVFAVTVRDKAEKEVVPYTLLKEIQQLELMVSTAKKGDVFTFEVLRIPNRLLVEVEIGQHPGAFSFFSTAGLGFERSDQYF